MDGALGLREVEGNMGGGVFMEKDYTFLLLQLHTDRIRFLFAILPITTSVRIFDPLFL
jgi:hypothetical protein